MEDMRTINQQPRPKGTAPNGRGYVGSPVELHSGFNTLYKRPEARTLAGALRAEGIKPLSTNKGFFFVQRNYRIGKLKSKFTAVVFLLAMLSWSEPLYGQSGGNIPLDDAIDNASLKIQDGLNRGATVIVYQFQSDNPKISDYVLKELFDKLVNSHKFIVLDRTAQEVIDAELDFQFAKSANMISDESLASLTKRIGAEAIVTGSLDDAGNEYRFRIRVIGTETTAAIVSHAESVNKSDRRITALQPKPPKTAGEKIGTGALNILFGLGSYLEGDIAGGITLTVGDVVAVGLFIVEATVLDWDSPAVGVPATIGVTALGLTIVYGFARPFIYNYSPKVAEIIDTTQPRIIRVSSRNDTSDSYGNRNIGFQISYTLKF